MTKCPIILLIKARALEELSRRQASNVQHSEDFYHPWSLPKGNFKHRMLSTGMYWLTEILPDFTEWTIYKDEGF